ncbi:hypothetical protein HBH56_109540 [Parastagonospora nodorum]|nr:hypothetical protein HBH56_109540 [Parastagonospora nodorum]KAH3922299.1 hypothetical protein HBH54_226650 [Parastagonospora nodorum]KAH3999527.1 hypothetical protein HBI10_112510 [Parastagonospora nodorum]KAH4014651.1 hypothetical protein HBI13_168840 [Parastagonospora nodorum]KAH4035075.1 hypothetical protein HBI09_094950 [Parastagonospora nodorum]
MFPHVVDFQQHSRLNSVAFNQKVNKCSAIPYTFPILLDDLDCRHLKPSCRRNGGLCPDSELSTSRVFVVLTAGGWVYPSQKADLVEERSDMAQSRIDPQNQTAPRADCSGWRDDCEMKCIYTSAHFTALNNDLWIFLRKGHTQWIPY